MSSRRGRTWTLMLALTILALVPSQPAQATSFHTISIDGTNDFAADESFATSTGGYNAYFTWDASNLYLGASGGELSGGSSTKWLVWYFDTDPQYVPLSARGSANSVQFNTQSGALPFRADYMLQVRHDQGLNQLKVWNGSSWVATTFTGAVFVNNGANFGEVRLPLSDVGNPTRVYALGHWINEQDGSQYTSSGWPSGGLTDGYDPDFTQWYGYRLATGAAPNDAAQLNSRSPIVDSVGASGMTPSAADNDYRRLANAVQALTSGATLQPVGTFDWTEANAAASWALGNDNTASTSDDYSLSIPQNLNNVTVAAASLGSATIQGPGDLASQDLEGVFFFNGGDNQNWTIANLQFYDFDNAIGMFSGAGGADAYNGTTITNNTIRLATDLNATVAPADTSQNIGLHYAFGQNQTISNNTFIIPGNGVSDSGGGTFATSVGMQSNSSGGTIYDGLLIDNNTITILNAQSADPESILGIWENGRAHTSDITVSNNDFVNMAGGNDPATNRQRAFRLTSHSSASTNVVYSGNTVNGANTGFQWLAGNNFTGNQPIRITGNSFTNVTTGLQVQSNGLAQVAGNSFTTGSTPFETAAGTSVVAYANNISGFANGHTGTGAPNLRHNYWGTTDPLAAALPGLDATTWAARLGVDVEGWADGTGTATLGGATLSGGTGTGVIVSHGRDLVSDSPFGNGTAGYGDAMCSEYYDFFTVNGGGNWTVTVPVDNNVSCNANTRDMQRLYWIADISQCTPSTNLTCWDLVAGTTTSGQTLQVAGLTAAQLGGTPFVAGSPQSTDPNLATVRRLTATPASPPLAGLGVAVVLGVLGLARYHRTTRKQRPHATTSC
jgi:hypothetical protein